MNGVVYATKDYYYALIRAGDFDITKFLIREEYSEKDNIRQLAEIEPGAFKKVFDRPGHIYIVDESTFIYNKGSEEYISRDKVKIKAHMYIDNIWNEINKHLDKYELITYDNTEEYWKNVRGGKEGYLKRKQEYVNKVLKYIEESE